MSDTEENRQAKITTPLKDDKGKEVLLLSDMTMTEELGRLFTIDIELLSLTENIDFEALLGKKITVEMDLIYGEKRYFNGHVTRFSQSGNSGSYAVYQATVRPWLWFLTRTSNCRIFQNKTVPEIVKEIFSDTSHKSYVEISVELSNAESYRKWNYCVQYRETDFNFISRLLEQEGIYYYFTHDEDKHTLVLADDYIAHEALLDNDEVLYYPPNESVVRKDDHISSWFVSKQIQPGKYALKEYNYEKPADMLNPEYAIQREHEYSSHKVYDYPGEYEAQQEGESYSKIRLEELHTQYEQAQGQSDVRALYAGGLFKLKNYPREDQNKEYLIVNATHSLNSDSFGSGGGGGAFYSNSFSVIDSKTPYRPARTTPKPIIQGAQTAKVVGKENEEIDTEKLGRVKLKFHWDLSEEVNEKASCWVRVAQVWAGKGWGGIHIPRIGQEVIVEFLEGDPDRPIITGRVYNAEQTPPYKLPENKTQSGIKSRSTKDGKDKHFNEIRMEDKKGKEELYIHAERNLKTIVEASESRNVRGKRSTNIGEDENINIQQHRTVHIKEGHETLVVHTGNHTQDVNTGHSTLNVRSGNRDVDVPAGTYQLIAKEVEITGHTNIKLVCGGSSIEITNTGISIKSSIIKLN